MVMKKDIAALSGARRASARVAWFSRSGAKGIRNSPLSAAFSPSEARREHEGMRYGLFIPSSYDSSRSYPLIIRLHDSIDTVSWDLSWYHDPIQSNDPCFVLTPKSLVEGNGWGNSWESRYSPDMQKTLEVIHLLMEEFNINSNRLYIHGASMGGFGVFNVLAKEPGMFAAAFSICGGGDPATAENVMQTPLWIFHGSIDNIVPVEYSRNIYQAILNAGGRLVRYTEYQGVGHAAWEPAWKEPTLESWLLAHEKGVKHGTPDMVQNLKYKIISNTNVELAWDLSYDNTDPDKYVWYYLLLRDFEIIAEIDNTDSTYMDLNLESSSTYTYSISAINYFFERSKGSVVSVDIP
jgi:poly(3-hydroxybutyrate) depolymerase